MQINFTDMCGVIHPFGGGAKLLYQVANCDLKKSFNVEVILTGK